MDKEKIVTWAKRDRRSSRLKVGCFAVIRKIMEQKRIPETFWKPFKELDRELVLDFAAYFIIPAGNYATFRYEK